MSFPKYPSYKPSGVDWLHEMPEHWRIIRTKHLFDLMKRSPEGDDEIVTAFRDGEVTLRSNRRVEGFTNAIHEHGYQRVLKGDLVIHAMDAFAGAIGVSDSNGKSTPVYSVCTPKNITVNSIYFGKLLRHLAVTGYINSLSKGVRERSTEFRWSEAGNVPLTVPGNVEQSLIVSFLERETAKIDELVAEQRRLMDLLKEKRQAIISRSVTRGLIPNVPTKASGIEWLGDVPAHWEILPIKRIVAIPITDGPHETPQFVDEGIPFVSAEAVSSGRIDFSKIRACITAEDNARFSEKYSPKINDIYMVKSGATTGVTAIVEDRVDFNIWSPLAVIRCGAKALPLFILNFMRSRNYLEAVSLNWSFGTQQNIGMGVIENIPVALPPLSEQHLIVEFLDQETARFETLGAEAQRVIDLLLERRTALISAVVTGQIDVRTLAEGQPE
jgi:type I restriction enzyme, S subunit